MRILACVGLSSVLIGAMMCLVSTTAELERFEHPTKGDGSVSFLVIGDWGRRGAFNQSQVALQMGRIGDRLNIDFVVSTGDNFYDNGLRGEHDPAFEESFTKIYTAPSLQKQWYSGKFPIPTALLGNHDYRGDAEAQLSPFLRKIDSRWLCLRSFLVNAAEIAELFFIDTTPFVDMYFTDSDEHTYDWRGIPSQKVYTANLLKEIESALKESNAKWKIVVGHHAIRSIGYHGDTKELVNRLLPILRANNVDFYMNGHDHCLEHISDTKSPLQFLTSGGGSKAWRGHFGGLNREALKFYYDGQGFMSVQLIETDQSAAIIVFYDAFGNVLHRLNVSKQFHPAI